MISGIDELPSGSVEVRKTADATTIERIAETLDILNLHVNPEEVTRIGKINANRPRLIRFKCKDDGKRSLLLSKARELKNNSLFSSVRVFPDRTLIQRQNAKALQDELALRKQSGEDVIIKNGRVVDRSLVEQNFRHMF